MGTIRRINEKYLGYMRTNRIDNNTACMATAVLWASRSKDPSSQVGAVFVNEQGRVFSIGYNGAPNNWPDEEFPWGRDTQEGKNINNTKYPYVIHAEMNGIINYMGDNRDFIDSTLFVTLFPCEQCAKFLAQRGVKKVIYLSDKYALKDEEFDEKYNYDANVAAKRTLAETGVEVVSYDSINPEHAEELRISLMPDKGVEVIEGKKRVRKIDEH